MRHSRRWSRSPIEASWNGRQAPREGDCARSQHCVRCGTAAATALTYSGERDGMRCTHSIVLNCDRSRAGCRSPSRSERNRDYAAGGCRNIASAIIVFCKISGSTNRTDRQRRAAHVAQQHEWETHWLNLRGGPQTAGSWELEKLRAPMLD